MDKTSREFLLAHGYKEVSDIKDVIRQGKVKDLHIDVCKSEPAVLLARAKERSAVIIVDGSGQEKRLVITRSDNFKTYLFNVPLEMITDVMVKTGDNMKTILFNVDSNEYELCYRK